MKERITSDQKLADTLANLGLPHKLVSEEELRALDPTWTPESDQELQNYIESRKISEARIKPLESHVRVVTSEALYLQLTKLGIKAELKK